MKLSSSFWAKNWHLLYFVLAAFDVLAICASLLSSHNNLTKYEQAIQYTESKMEILALVSKVSSSAQHVNAPGNDVFDSKNPREEKKRFDTAILDFNHNLSKLRLSINSDTANSISSINHQMLENKIIENITFSMSQMRALANQIFTLIQNKEDPKAATLMAEMDRSYANLNNVIEEYRLLQTDQISQVLKDHHHNLKITKKLEIYFSILVLFAVIGIAIFGKYLSRFVKNTLKDAKRSQEILATISNTAIIAFTDKKGKITEVNDNFCKISGYSRKELIGHNHRIVKSEAHPKSFFEDLWEKISSGESWTGDIQNLNKNGEPYFVRSVLSPIKGVNGEIEQYMAIRFDVSEQKKIENDLRLAQTIAKIGSWSFDIASKRLTWSSELYHIFKIDEPQSDGDLFKLYWNCIHPDDLPKLQYMLNNAIQFGKDYTIDHRISLDGGKQIKYVKGIAHVTKDKLGNPIRISGTCQDISEIRMTELENSTTLKTMSEGLVIHNQSGAIEKFNPSAITILGLNEDQVLGSLSTDLYSKFFKEDRTIFLKEEHPVTFALKTNQALHNIVMGLCLPSGEERWIKTNAIPFESMGHRKVIVTFSDITEIIQSKFLTKKLQEQNHFILKSMGVGAWIFYPLTQELSWDQSMYELYGLSASDFSGDYHAWENSLSTETKQRAVEELGMALRGEKDFDTTFEIVTKSGVKKQIGGKGVVIRNERNEPIAMHGINWDRASEIRGQKELKKLHDLNNAIIRSANFAIITTDLNGIITGFNNEAERILGYSADEIIGKLNPALFHEPNEVVQRAKQLSIEFKTNVAVGFETFIFKAKKGQGHFDDCQWTYIRKDGKRVQVQLNVTGLYDFSGALYGFMGIARDISAVLNMQFELEQERIKSLRNAKLASLGEMSAGMAHEINNPLAIISGSAGLISRFSNDPKKLASKVESIKKSCDRISRIVTGLQKFSRSGDKAHFKIHTLDNIIRETIILTEVKSKRHSVPVTVNSKTFSVVSCDDVEIEQVLVNLINNAIDAVKNNSEKWVKIDLFDDGNSVVLRITDSGPGIPESIREKLFDPFFTTKKVGEGTGLGLSISKGILDEHKATISVVTESLNTCFEIRFPRTQEMKNAV